jgi:hypothetical protein
MGDLWNTIRSRMWPTRRLFDGRQRELAEELATYLADVRGSLGAQLSEQRRELAELAAIVAQLRDGQAEIRTRMRRTQALTARAYEAVHDWSGQLAAARSAPDYELPYEDPDPLISIAMSTYHSPDTLCERTLPSVLAQTHANWEAIVVGDHCTDDTAERLRALGDERIRFHNLPVRELDPADPWERWAVKGSVPRATGVELARGRWIAPLSHDDTWDPDHLERLLGAAREHRAELVYSRMRCVSADGSDPPAASIGAWPPRLGGFNCQSSLVHGTLRFLRYDRACALASEPNDWNLARRAWEAGVRFQFLDRETSTLYTHSGYAEILDELTGAGLPSSAVGYP